MKSLYAILFSLSIGVEFSSSSISLDVRPVISFLMASLNSRLVTLPHFVISIALKTSSRFLCVLLRYSLRTEMTSPVSGSIDPNLKV